MNETFLSKNSCVVSMGFNSVVFFWVLNSELDAEKFFAVKPPSP